MKLPYKPIKGMSFGKDNERCAIGWCVESLFGRENLKEENGRLTIPSLPPDLVFDLATSKKIAVMNDTGSFDEAFKMLPKFIEANKELFAKHGGKVDETLEKIKECIND